MFYYPITFRSFFTYFFLFFFLNYTCDRIRSTRNRRSLELFPRSPGNCSTLNNDKKKLCSTLERRTRSSGFYSTIKLYKNENNFRRRYCYRQKVVSDELFHQKKKKPNDSRPLLRQRQKTPNKNESFFFLGFVF